MSPVALAALGLAGAATASVPAEHASARAPVGAGERLAAEIAAEAAVMATGQAGTEAFVAQMAALIQQVEGDAGAPTAADGAGSAELDAVPMASEDVVGADGSSPGDVSQQEFPIYLALAEEATVVSDSGPMLLADASAASAGSTGAAAGGSAEAATAAGTSATTAATTTAAAAAGSSLGGLLAVVGGLALAGGGGGGGGGAAAAVAGTAVSGVVSDGLISGAEVYVDMNDNGVVDNGDVKIGTTNADGTFSGTLTDAQKAHALIAVGGTDISTGLAFKGAFSAPAGSSVITPLTTLVQALAQQGVAVAEAKAQVAEALGLPTSVDLTTFNAVAGMVSGDTSTATQAQAIEIQAKALMVANLIATGTAALEGAAAAAGGTASASTLQGLSTTVVSGLVNVIKAASDSDTSVDLSDSTTLHQVMTTAVATAKETVVLDDTIANSALSATADAVAAANELINTAAGSAAQAAESQSGALAEPIVEALTQMLQAQSVVQGTVAGALDNGTSGDVNSVSTNYATLNALLGASNGVTTGLKLTNNVNVDTNRAADNTAPTVSSVTGSATATPFNAGDRIEFKVTMSEGLLVGGGSPLLDITVGGNPQVATFDPGRSTGAVLVFVYRVGATDSGAVAVTGLDVNGATITDLAGNPAVMTLANVGSGWTVDNLAPTVEITSAASFLNSGSSTLVTFTLSEAAATGTFTAADIVLTGGSLGALTPSLTDAKIYTATLTPTSGSTAPVTVKVNGGVFTDAAGNANTASNVLAVGVDTVAPQVVVSSDTASLKAGQTADITFLLSKTSTDFTAGDVTVVGGTLTNFAGSGTTYSATFVPNAEGTATIRVSAATFTSSGNDNGASNTLSLAVDLGAPAIAISSNDNSLKAGEAATITFDLSEEAATGTFTKEDITVAGGTLGTLTQSSTDKTIYTATFTPLQESTAAGTITVAAGKFTDAAGNANTQGTLSLAVDTVRPRVSSVSDDLVGTASSATSNIAYTYTFSESVTGLAADDFTVTNGTVSSVSGSGTTWTVNVAPAANVAGGNVILTLRPGAVTDAAGNASIASTSGAQTLDTLAPSVAGVTDDVNGTVNSSTVSVTYTYSFSEAVSGLAAGDFVATNGTISAVAAVNPANGASAVWTVTVTPAAGVASGNIGLALNAAAVTDAVGNSNAGSLSNAQALDTVAPSVSSVTDNVSGTVNAATVSVVYTYTFSEAVTGLAAGDFVVTNGTVASVSGSGTTWTVTVTPSAGVASGNISLALSSGAVADAAGNVNGASTSAAQTIDTVSPSGPTLSPVDNGDSLGLAANLTLTFAEAMAKGSSGNIVLYKGDGSVVETIAVTDGKISVNGNVVSINPTADLVKDQTYYVKIDAGALTDTAGNAYAGISDATTWNFTGAGATVAINTVAGNDTVNASEAGSNIAVGGTLAAENTVLSAFTANDFTSAVLKPTSGSNINLTNLSYNPSTHGWTAQIDSGALSGTGDYTLEVTFTGSQGAAAGVVGTGSKVVHVDTVVATPTLALATDSGIGGDSLTNVGTVNVSGIENGAAWQYSTDGGNNWSAGSGTSVTLSGDGAKTLVVKQTDAAGNASANSSSLAFTLDATAPSKPVITALSTDSGAAGDRITSDNTPTFTVTAETGTTIHIGQNGTAINSALYNVVETGTAGTYTVTVTGALADGGYGMVVVDTAGNVSPLPTAGETATFLIDTTAPTQTVSAVALSADTGTAGDFITNTAAQTITATLSAGLGLGEKLLGSLDNGSNWNDVSGFVSGTTVTLTGATLAGSSTMKLKVQDAAGNDGQVASQAYVLDASAPTQTIGNVALSVDSGTAGDFKTNTAAQTITATLSAGLGAGEKLFGSLDNGSTWVDVSSFVSGNSLTLTGITLTGSSTMKLKVQDAAGNDGPVASQAYILDTSAPAAISLSMSSQGDLVYTGKEATAAIQVSANGTSGWAAFNPDTDIPNNTEITRYFRQVDDAGNAGPASATAYTFFQGTTGADSQNFSSKTNTVFSMLDAGNDSIVGGSAADNLWGEAGADTMAGGGGADSINVGANDSAVDVLKLLAATDSTQAAPDMVTGFASDDKIDFSALLSAYTSSTLADTGAGFVELKNLVLTKGSSTTQVKFDVTLDAATIGGSKITGGVIDLSYNYAALNSSGTSASSITYSVSDGFGGSTTSNVWSNVVGNFTGNGKIALTANFTVGNGGNPDYTANPIVDANGKTLGVTLIVNSLVDTFTVGLESKSSGGSTELTAENGKVYGAASDSGGALAVGITKTAGATVGTSGVLEIVADTGTLGTVGDNQLHFVSSYNANTQTTHLQVQFDTDSTYGSGHTTASGLIVMDFAGDVTANLVPANLTFI